MAIISDQAPDADEVMNSFGANFIDNSQLLFNADYIGFSAKLHNTGVPNLDNVFYSTFQTDDAEVNYNFLYDASSDLYKIPDLSSVSNYVVIEATSYDGDWVNGTNDVNIISLESGKWLVYATTGTSEVQKAKVHKSLWWGDGTPNSQTKTPLILDFTTITAVKVSDAGDIGKQTHTVRADAFGFGTSQIGFTGVGTFVNTSTNTNVNSWSYMITLPNTADEIWQIPNGITLNTGTNDELETDTSGDDKSNPADCRITGNRDGGSSASGGGIAIILCKGDMTWVMSGTITPTEIDFLTDHSIPVFTAADSLVDLGTGTSTLIFKDTASSSVTNAIASINSTIDATSSEQISISANGGSNYTDVNNGEIARPTPGTALWRRIVITRATLDKQDIITEQAIKFNYY